MRPRRQILTPVILPLLVAGMLVQAIVPLLRLNVTYQALDEGMDARTVGLLSAVFQVLPVFLTVAIGRFNDRGGVALATVLGSFCLIVGCVTLWWLPTTLTNLLVATAILGIGQTLCISSLQLIALISSTRAHRDNILGNYMVAMSLGQAIGPLFLGLGGWIFLFSFASLAVTLIASLILLKVVPQRRSDTQAEKISLVRIAATPGLPWIILTGSICVAALDLLLAFMPVLGEARGLAPATVGLLLSLRAIAAVLSRLFFGRAVKALGRMRLMLSSVLVSAFGLLLLALPLPIWVTGAALIAIGFGLGLALTSSIALTMQIAPPSVRGTALSLRLTANRIAQLALPIVAGLVIAPFGTAGIFGVTGVALLIAPFARPRNLSVSN